MMGDLQTLTEPTPIEGGWRVRETDRYWVDVLVMMGGNTRIVLTPKAFPWQYDRGWCYRSGLVATVLGCVGWDPDAGEEPTGWIKEVGTERRNCGAYIKGPRLHMTYVAGCEHCGDEALA
jgi:hypothetical protein